MSRDPIDELGARLFEAAREEQPPQGAEQRALEVARCAAVSGSTSLSGVWHVARPKLLLWAAALALVLGLVAFGRREQPTSAIKREPLATTTQARASEAAVVPQPSAPPTASSEVRPAPRVVPTLARSAATLSDELELLKVAQNALVAGNTGAALQALDRYDVILRGNKKLVAEATLLRVETLSRAGQAKAAAELARDFIAKNPTSPLVDRARSFISKGE